MIRKLSVEKFKLIRGIEIEFSEGLNVISGETGTGKSMTLSALSFVMGKQGKYEEGDTVEIELEKSGESLFLRREVRNGRSRYFINGRSTTAESVREILQDKISLQGQNEFIKIKRSDFQRDLIDFFANLVTLRKKVSRLYIKIQEKQEELRKLLELRDDALKRKEFIEYRIKEIEDVGISLDEEEKIKTKAEILKKSETFLRNLRLILDVLYEKEDSAFEKIGMALKHLRNLEHIDQSLIVLDEKLINIKDSIKEIYYILKEKDFELSEEEIDTINEKLFQIQQLERKYGKPYREILKETEVLKRELFSCSEIINKVNQFKEEIAILEKEYQKVCTKLSEKRKKSTPLLCKKVMEILKDLNLERAVLDIAFKKAEAGKYGCDKVVFLFSSHGENLQPLDRVASGGELTRLYLAISLILPPTKTYVFDEVEAGISGEASLKLAKLLKKLSEKMQIIVVTHSAPLCAAGDKNLRTFIEYIGNIPYVRVDTLTKEEKLKEVARLMGATTENTLKGAEELVSIVNK